MTLDSSVDRLVTVTKLEIINNSIFGVLYSTRQTIRMYVTTTHTKGMKKDKAGKAERYL